MRRAPSGTRAFFFLFEAARIRVVRVEREADRDDDRGADRLGRVDRVDRSDRIDDTDPYDRSTERLCDRPLPYPLLRAVLTVRRPRGVLDVDLPGGPRLRLRLASRSCRR